MGTTYISNKLAHILIDPCATFLFTSFVFIMHNKLKSYDSSELVVISIPMGMSLICKLLIKDVLGKIEEEEMK